MAIEDFRCEYKWLSNFELAEVELDGIKYPSTEHAYQAAKTLDPSLREAIRAASTPGKAKRLGNEVKLRSNWDHIKISIMHDLVRQKFMNHPHLRERLILTGRQHLVEGNTWGDVFWGVYQGEGENHLGRILMDVRAEILGLPVARPIQTNGWICDECSDPACIGHCPKCSSNKIGGGSANGMFCANCHHCWTD